jgi:hypothetical protein
MAFIIQTNVTSGDNWLLVRLSLSLPKNISNDLRDYVASRPRRLTFSHHLEHLKPLKPYSCYNCWVRWPKTETVRQEHNVLNYEILEFFFLFFFLYDLFNIVFNSSDYIVSVLGWLMHINWKGYWRKQSVAYCKLSWHLFGNLEKPLRRANIQAENWTWTTSI